MMIRLLLLSLSFVFAFGLPLASASDCSPIDLRETTLKNMPVMQQDGVGICYAYAASAMVDAWRFSKGDNRTKFLTSPIDAAIQEGATYSSIGASAKAHLAARSLKMKDSNKGLSLTEDEVFRAALLVDGDTGVEFAFDQVTHNTCDVAESILKTGSCDAQRVRDKYGSMEFPAEGRPEFMTSETWLESVGTLYDTYHMYRTQLGQVTKVEGDLMREKYSNLSCTIQSKLGFATDTSAAAMEALRIAIKQENPIYYLKKIIDPLCPSSSRIYPPAFSCKSERFLTDDSVVDERLDAALKAGVPLGLDFCSGVLKKGPSYKGVNIGSYVSDGYGSVVMRSCKNEDAHAVAMIGRRPDPKNASKCQYLIRNSWGADCSTYSWCADPQASTGPSAVQGEGLAPKTAPSLKGCKKVEKWDCKDGNIWVDADALKANSTRIHVMGDQ